MLRMPRGREAKKRVDGSETGIAGSNAVRTFGLQMLEEGGHRGRTEVCEVKVRGFLSAALMNESEEQAEAPPIRDNRVWASVALLREPGREEGLEGWCDEAHWCTLREPPTTHSQTIDPASSLQASDPDATARSELAAEANGRHQAA